MNEVTAPVIATTLVLVAVFIPVAVMGGITGSLVSAICHNGRRFGLLLIGKCLNPKPRTLFTAAQKATTFPRFAGQVF